MHNISAATGVSAFNKYLDKINKDYKVKNVIESTDTLSVEDGDILFLSYNLPGNKDILNVLDSLFLDVRIIFMIPDDVADVRLIRIRELLKRLNIEFYFGNNYKKRVIENMLLYEKSKEESFSEITGIIDDGVDYEEFKGEVKEIPTFTQNIVKNKEVVSDVEYITPPGRNFGGRNSREIHVKEENFIPPVKGEDEIYRNFKERPDLLKEAREKLEEEAKEKKEEAYVDTVEDNEFGGGESIDSFNEKPAFFKPEAQNLEHESIKKPAFIETEREFSFRPPGPQTNENLNEFVFEREKDKNGGNEEQTFNFKAQEEKEDAREFKKPAFMELNGNNKKLEVSTEYTFTPPPKFDEVKEKLEEKKENLEENREEVLYKRPTQIIKPDLNKMDEEIGPSYSEYKTQSIEDVRRNELVDVRKIGEKEIIEDPCNYDRVVPNLSIVSSIKPGTGKSFLSVNLAAGIARYGKPTKNGNKPLVGLIEGDLQNLSVGTLLGIGENSRTIKSALLKISEIITQDGTFIGNTYSVENVNNYLRSSFVPYLRQNNLLCLTGSQIKFEEIKGFNQYQFKYLVESMSLMFDVLIVDTNSALTHISSYPLLKTAKSCFYVLNLDYNNIKNNSRYRHSLEELKIMNKVKYIINEDITKDIEGNFKEKLKCNKDLIANSGFNVVGSVPIVDKSIFLNRIYEGLPIVLD